ncbi:MAG TPA: hypothetical protein PK315_04650 [Petrotogaceae bacterium]|jgi:hypothetical protein|nr:hypothetical protein [Petrotogaceae bacterium]HPO26739.1 hypothetical protein [Petrotogaceae bacterium]
MKKFFLTVFIIFSAAVIFAQPERLYDYVLDIWSKNKIEYQKTFSIFSTDYYVFSQIPEIGFSAEYLLEESSGELLVSVEYADYSKIPAVLEADLCRNGFNEDLSKLIIYDGICNSINEQDVNESQRFFVMSGSSEICDLKDAAYKIGSFEYEGKWFVVKSKTDKNNNLHLIVSFKK